MADLTRPDFGEAWASEGEKLSPDSVKIKLGWVQEMMPYQFENFLQSRQDEAILYLLQKGVPEYSPTQEYTANKSVVVYQGNLYMATATVTGVLPTVTASWKRISPTVGTNGAVAISSGGTGATSVAEARTNLGLGTASTANLPSTNGVVVRSGDNTLISRLLTGTSGNISITNPDGVAGNININVGNNVAQLDKDSSWTSKGGITLPKGSSSERGVEVPGKIRYNTELQKFEGFNGTSWNALGATSEVEITTLSGDGTTTVFTLNTPAFSESSTDVYIGGVYQNKGTYSVSGTTLTFSEAPTPGTDNIQVVSRRVVDLGIARASQVSIEDAANKYTATTVEGALREITEYEGEIEAEASWDDVPKHKTTAFNTQAQALANRTEMLTYGIGAYDKIRSYSGSGTKLKVQDPTGVHWWVRRGSSADNGGTVLVDALGRSWEREYSGAVDVKWFGAKGDGVTDDREAIKKAIAASEVILFSPGKYRVTASDYDSVRDWRHHFVVPSNRTLTFDGAEIITNTSYATRAVIFLVRGSNVEFNKIRTNDLGSFVIPIGAGSTYDSSYPEGEFSELYINNGVFKNSWLSVSVQFSRTDGGDKSFRCIRVNNSMSFARPGNTSSGNFNFRCEGESLWKVKDVQLDTCSGYNGATASSFNFVGVDGFAHSNCTSYYNKYAGTEVENGCQDGTISNFRSVDDLWGVWIDDSRRVTVNGVTHSTISESLVSPLMGTFYRYREAVKITREGFTNHQDWVTEGIIVSGVVSNFGRVTTGAFGDSPQGAFGKISISGVMLYGDGVSRARDNTLVQIRGAKDITLNDVSVFGAPSRAIEVTIPEGGLHKLSNIKTDKVAEEDSIGIYSVGAGRLSLNTVVVHSADMTNTYRDYYDVRINGVLQPMRQRQQSIYFASGIPEGSLAAGPGSLALSSVTGKLYVKETGTGNTGWVQK